MACDGDDGSEDLEAVRIEQAVSSLTRLSEGRPRGWEALYRIMSLLIALVRGLRPGGHRFWMAFHQAFIRALRHGFTALLVGGTAPDCARPFFDWHLLSMLRSCCLALRSSCVDDAEMRGLAVCYVAAVAQVRAHALGATNAEHDVVQQTGPRSWDAAESFVRLVKPHMPVVNGLWGSSAETLVGSVPNREQRPLGSRAGSSAAAMGQSEAVVMVTDSDPEVL